MTAEAIVYAVKGCVRRWSWAQEFAYTGLAHREDYCCSGWTQDGPSCGSCGCCFNLMYPNWHFRGECARLVRAFIAYISAKITPQGSGDLDDSEPF